MKNSVYGTMHFEGILKHPHKPNMILYERAPVKYHHFYLNRSSQDQPTHSSQISTARRSSQEPPLRSETKASQFLNKTAPEEETPEELFHILKQINSAQGEVSSRAALAKE